MKILISASYYAPHISGLTNSVKNLSELLAKKDYDVTVLTAQHRKDLKQVESLRGVLVIRVPYLLKFHKGFIMPSFLYRAFKEIKKSDQVLVSLPQFEGFIVAVLARFMGKKVHSIYACEVKVDHGFFSKLIEQVLRTANRSALSFSDTIITLSSDFAKHAQLIPQSSDKLRSIYPVILPPTIEPLRIKSLLGKLMPKRQYYIGFIGRIAPEKGIEYLLQAIPVLKKRIGNNFAIVLAGPTLTVGEEKYLKKITNIVKNYEENIIQLGELKLDELGAFYSVIDTLVLPSINTTEAFGMVQVEAMFCTAPVITTDLPGVRVPVQVTGMGEIAKRKDSVDLADKIAKVLQDKNLYLKDRRVIEKAFSIEKIIAQYEKVLRKS